MHSCASPLGTHSLAASLPLGRLIVSGICLFSSFLLPLASQAQATNDKAAADALFDAARSLMTSHDYRRACPKFKDSYALDPAVGTLLNLALCYKKAGQTASAWATYRGAASLARQNGHRDREDLARSEAKKLEQIVTRLVIEVSPEAEAIVDLSIKREGKLLARSIWGVPVAVDPGDVTIEVSAPGHVSQITKLKVLGKGKTVPFQVLALEAASPTALASTTIIDIEEEPNLETEKSPQSESRPQDAGGSQETQSAWPWVLGGVGLGIAGAGTGLAIYGRSQVLEAEVLCENAICDNESDKTLHDSLQTQGVLNQTLGFAAVGVGCAAIAGSVIWLVVRKPKSSSALHLQPIVGSSTWGFSAYGSF